MKKHWLVVVTLLVFGCIVLVACGGTENPTTSNPATSSPTTPSSTTSSPTTSSSQSASTPSPSANAQTVNVREGEMYIKSDVTSFKVGTPYHFVVKNEGKVVHEFTITRKVPGGNEKSRDAASVKDVDNIAPGQTMTFDFTFKEPAPASGMEFECSYPGHYEMGMHMDITVA